MYANITLFFYICKQIAKIFHIAGIYFSIFLHISKIMLIFVMKILLIIIVIIFVSMVPRRCETMGIFYCLIVDINNIVGTLVNIKYIVNKLGNFVRWDDIDFCYEISADFYYNTDTIFNEREKRYFGC